jgi:hypothetical protein
VGLAFVLVAPDDDIHPPAQVGGWGERVRG